MFNQAYFNSKIQSASHEWRVSIQVSYENGKKGGPVSLQHSSNTRQQRMQRGWSNRVVMCFRCIRVNAIIGPVIYIPSLHSLSTLFLHPRNIEIILRKHPVLQRRWDMPLSSHYWSNELVHFFHQDSCVFNFFDSARDLFSFLYVLYVWCALKKQKIYFFVYFLLFTFVSLRW